MSESLLYLIGGLDVVLYASIALGYVFARKGPTLHINDLREAFEYLEKSLRRAFPDLREGFTWKEAMLKIRLLYSSADWPEIDNVLQKYQAYRYGGVDPGNVKIDSIVKLAMTLPRGTKK